MRKQIEQVVEKFESLSKEEQEKVKKILEKYVNGEIKINEAYDSLVDEGLITILRVEPEAVTAKDEEELKQYIRNEILHISE